MKTIEERLEAISQAVELAAQMHIGNDRKFEERFKKTESQIGRIVGVTESLAEIAKSHEQRLDRIEGQ